MNGPASSSIIAEAEGPTASLDSAASLSLTRRVKRRCGPFCFSNSRRRIRSGTWPFISRDAMLSSTCNHREKAESSYQPASTWEAKVSCTWLLYIIIHLYRLKNLPNTADNSQIIPSSHSSLLFSKLFGTCLPGNEATCTLRLQVGTNH